MKFKRQKNYCSKVYKKEQRKYFESLNPRRISNNKSFWKNIQHFFSEKERLAISVLLLTIKKTLKTIWFQRNFSKMQQKAYENSYIIDTDSNEINSVEKLINK